MIRLNFPLHRVPNLSRAEFQRYWRETHGPLVASAARALRIRRYLQSHSVDDPLYDGLRAARTGMHEPFDGVACLWWDSRDDLLAALASEAGRKAGAVLLEDEKRFIDFSRSTLFATKEIVFVDEGAS